MARRVLVLAVEILGVSTANANNLCPLQTRSSVNNVRMKVSKTHQFAALSAQRVIINALPQNTKQPSV
jgi:hypothetical protein